MEKYPDHAGEATRIITETLDSLYPLVSEGVLAEEVWHELSEGVKGGWCSQAEADERFTAWYRQYHREHS